MAFSQPRSVVASAARTATGQSVAIRPQGFAHYINLAIDLTAVSGTTPTLDVTVEWSEDDGVNIAWFGADPADAFTQLTAVGSKVKQFTVKGNSYRVVWTIGGTTPSFTFQVLEYLT